MPLMMAVALVALLWGGICRLSIREVSWAERVQHRFRPRVTALRVWVSAAPMTVGYVAIWSVTSVIQQGTPASIQDVVDRYNSTNLTLLAHNPVRVLFSSAFIVADQAWGFSGYVLVYLLVVAALERRLGWRRTLVVWLAAHVVGSLATAVTEAVLIHYEVLPKTVSFASDVGVSYILVGSCGAYLWLASRTGRWLVGVGLLAGVWLPLLISHTVWDLGHAYATLLGVGVGWVVRKARSEVIDHGTG